MGCEDSDVTSTAEPLEATDLESARGRSNIEGKCGSNSIARPSDLSLSGGIIGDLNDDNTVQHVSKPESHNTSSDLGCHQDESPGKDDKGPSLTSVYDDLTTWVREQPKKLNVKWSDYESFQNRFSSEEGHDIIEVLEGHPDQLRTEISNEQAKRRHNNHPGLRIKRQVQNDPKVIHRVRIQSPAILHILGRLTGQWDQHDWDDTSLTFLRPFQTFYLSLPFAKQLLRMLQRGYTHDKSHEGEGTRHRGPLEHSYGNSSNVEADDPLQKLSISPDLDMEDIIHGLPNFHSETRGDLTAMEHMKIYVDFVETYIVPMWLQAKGASKPMVRFSDLPMYYRPGEILFEKLKSGGDKNKAGGMGSNAAMNEGLVVHQNYWKLSSATFEQYQPEKGRKEDDARISNSLFTVFIFHVDFDGERYGPVNAAASFDYFEGEKDIRGFSLFPLRFDPDAMQRSKDVITRAQNFLSYVQQRHLSYDGWTLIHETHATALRRNAKRRTEHIDGEIMIDFKEGFQSESGFVKPLLDLPFTPAGSGTILTDPLMSMDQDTMQIKWWSDTSRSKRKGYSQGMHWSSESFWEVQSSCMLKEDNVLRAYKKEEMVFDFGKYVDW